MPPINCISKCRSSNVRLLASRTTAKASGSRASSDSPPSARRLRNSSVFCFSSSLLNFSNLSSRALMANTLRSIFLSFRELLLPSILLSMFMSTYYSHLIYEFSFDRFDTGHSVSINQNDKRSIFNREFI